MARRTKVSTTTPFMAKRIKVPTTTPLRRSPRFQFESPKPNRHDSYEQHQCISVQKARPKSTPSSSSNSKGNCAVKKPKRGTLTSPSNVCEYSSKEEAVLDLSKGRRRSVRLALIDTSNTVSSVQTGNRGLALSSCKKKVSVSFGASKKVAIGHLNCDSPLLRRKCVRFMEAEKQNSISISSRPVQCRENVRQNGSEKSSITELSRDCSTGRRRSPRLAAIGNDEGESCLTTQSNQQISNESGIGIFGDELDGIDPTFFTNLSTVCENASKKVTPLNRRKSRRIKTKTSEITKKDMETNNVDSDSEESKEKILNGNSSKKVIPINRRQSKRIENMASEITKKDVESKNADPGSSEESEEERLNPKSVTPINRRKSKRIEKIISEITKKDVESKNVDPGSSVESEEQKLNPKSITPINRRKSKRIEKIMSEIPKKDTGSQYVDSDSSEESEEERLRGEKRKREETTEMEAPVECTNGEDDVGFDGWTAEQEMALQRAYFSARPSPHFWKKVSKMVPGKNAEECFTKIHSSHETPPSIPPKSRVNKSITDLSPFHEVNLLENLNSPRNHKPKTRRISKKKRTLDARKTVRHILKKHQLVDQVHQADYFSQFENSPIHLPSDMKFSENCPSSSVNHRKQLSRLNPNPNFEDPSPAVLKRVKNMELHEKYIDHLHYVDARRRACVKGFNNDNNNNKGKMLNLKDVKDTLVSEAQDYIGHFKRLQLDPFGDCVRSDEEE